MRIGILGFPQSGKTSLFNALTGSNHPVGGQHATGIGNVQVKSATISVPDPRVDWLCALYQPQKKTYAQITYADISGVQGGISRLPGDLLKIMSQMDGLCHVVRAFESEIVPHPMITVDPLRDISALDDELLLSDLLAVERNLERLHEEWKKGGGRDRSTIEREQQLFGRVLETLEDARPVRDMDFTPDENHILSGYGFLTRKPMIIVINTRHDDDLRNDIRDDNYGRHTTDRGIRVDAQLEMEISQLDTDDAELFLQEYGLEKACRYRMAKLSFDALGTHSFFTVIRDEVRAWIADIGATALESAGLIHSDMQTGFIRAEVAAYNDLHNHGSEAAAKTAGKWRLEGRDYVVQDGDILNIRFSPPAKK